MKGSLALAAVAFASCSDSPEPVPPPRAATQTEPDASDTARRDVRDAFRQAMSSPKHASDGGGRAWLELAEGETGAVVAGTFGRWTIVYEAGPLGIAAGGALYFQVSPFFEWSTPQVESEGAPGFTRVSTEADGIELDAKTLDQQLLGIEIGGRALAQGERVRIEYGAGGALAHADAYAEKNSRFWIAVDGDGDGVRKVLADSPGVDVLPGPPKRLVATLPSTSRPGERVRLVVALLDARANVCATSTATLARPEGAGALDLPGESAIGPGDLGRKTLELAAREPGVYRVRVRARAGSDELEALSNPMLVAEGGPRILWGDLHGHSAVSDGTGTPEDYYLYARDVAALDVAALTDHDHWGLVFVDETPELWSANLDVARRFHEPGRFVTLEGYEWTDWIGGHRHVLYFSGEARLYSAMDERYDTPQELWSALRAHDAITIPHHPAGGPIAIDWSVEPDAALEPVVEVCSAHGMSEALDCQRVIHSPRPGRFVRDALELGYRYGLAGSGDGHDGHPGLAWLGPHYPTGGLVAILANETTREAVRDALRARRVYATSGPRILLRFALGRARMGEAIPAAEANRPDNLYVHAIGTAPIEAVDIVRKGGEVARTSVQGFFEYAASATVEELAPGDWVYVRVVQADGAAAWSSPVFVE